MHRTIAATLLALGFGGGHLYAQDPAPLRRSLDGPRVGVTYAAGRRELGIAGGRRLSPWVSQFGWHEEQEVIPSAQGPALVVQQVVLIGGVEQGAFLLSATALLGVRTPAGFELGIGPNLSFEGPGLAIAAGQSFDYGGVRIPVDVAMVEAQGRWRTTFLVGFAVKSPS
jgi:hypothetical protein